MSWRRGAVVIGLLCGCGFAVDGSGEAGGSASASGTSDSTGNATSATSEATTTTDAASGDATGSSTAGVSSTAGDSTSGESTTGVTDSTTDASATDAQSSGLTSGASTGAGVTTDATATSGSTGSPASCHPVIAEALVSVGGADDGREWVTLYNHCDDPIDLDGYSFAWGELGIDGTNDLSGIVAAGECFVVGGPGSDAGNFDPIYDLTAQFAPQLWRPQGAPARAPARARSRELRNAPRFSTPC